MSPKDKSRSSNGLDLFAGAGGMSLGAKMAGIDVKTAIEMDPHAVATYVHNHPETEVFTGDIRKFKRTDLPQKGQISILFGGPPCQGFSTSNQRTRNQLNSESWLFEEFVRVADLWKPDWVVFENVTGIIETEGGIFRDQIIADLEDLGYTTSSGVLGQELFLVEIGRGVQSAEKAY